MDKTVSNLNSKSSSKYKFINVYYFYSTTHQLESNYQSLIMHVKPHDITELLLLSICFYSRVLIFTCFST